MWERHYDVVMGTPIGERYGTMAVTVEGEEIHGTLRILKKANPFFGTIQQGGQCRLHGELTTLMRTIPYDAMGRVTQEALELALRAAQESFSLRGKAAQEGAEARGEAGI